ncbi:MAG TPA: ANTAR domain-containing protein [Jiangellales bacterium]|nr:ANTAR domain-containing protein [Jiangellales bacterium]
MTRWAGSAALSAGEPRAGEAGEGPEHGTDDGADDLLRALLASARSVAGAARVEDALPCITEGAVAVVPGVRDAGIALRGRGGMLVCRANTTETAARVDQAQVRRAEGPCIDALSGGDTVVLPDARTERRWPRFVPEAVAHGVRASVSVRFMSSWPVGTLNLHVTQHALDDPRARMRALWAARMFVAHSSLALAGAGRVENLEEAISRRDVIGQAKGILIDRYGVDADEARERLRRVSRTTNTEVHHTAVWIVACRTPRGGRAAPPPRTDS